MRLLSLLMGATLFALVSCSGGEENGEGNGDEPATPVTPTGSDEAGAGEASYDDGGEALAAICCDGADYCTAPAGYCCTDGTCNGAHEELPVHKP